LNSRSSKTIKGCTKIRAWQKRGNPGEAKEQVTSEKGSGNPRGGESKKKRGLENGRLRDSHAGEPPGVAQRVARCSLRSHTFARPFPSVVLVIAGREPIADGETRELPLLCGNGQRRLRPEDTAAAPTEQSRSAPREQNQTAPTEQKQTAPRGAKADGSRGSKSRTATREQNQKAPTEPRQTAPKEPKRPAPTEQKQTAPWELKQTAPEGAGAARSDRARGSAGCPGGKSGDPSDAGKQLCSFHHPCRGK
jgi:hypothetical protein